MPQNQPTGTREQRALSVLTHSRLPDLNKRLLLIEGAYLAILEQLQGPTPVEVRKGEPDAPLTPALVPGGHEAMDAACETVERLANLSDRLASALGLGLDNVGQASGSVARRA